MNAAWDAWVPAGNVPARATVEAAGQPGLEGGNQAGGRTLSKPPFDEKPTSCDVGFFIDFRGLSAGPKASRK